jgi:hypothetical protein
MCVLICADPGVNEWLAMVAARAHRSALQLTASCVVSPSSHDVDAPILDKAAVRRIARGPILREHEWPQRGTSPSAQEWKHPFDVLSEAWSRLLCLVGLRR